MNVLPPEASLFHPVRDRYGLRLALVFGNGAPGGVCPFYRRDKCWHCDIGAGEGRRFDADDNRRRLAALQERYAKILPQVAHLVVFNSGSTLNPTELDRTFLREVVAWGAGLPCIRQISLDSRESFIRARHLEPLLEVAGSVPLRPILGLESADDATRNGPLQKAMSKRSVARALADLARLPGRVGLDANLLIAGPGTERRGAVPDALTSARYLWRSCSRHGLPLDLNLEPYYPSVRSSAHHPDHPRCSPVQLAHVVLALAEWSRVNTGGHVGLFVGLQDEQHDQEPEKRRELQAFQAFNATGEIEGLRNLLPRD